MPFIPLDTSSPRCVLPQKLNDIRECMAHLALEDIEILENATTIIRNEYSSQCTTPDDINTWSELLDVLIWITKALRIATEIQTSAMHLGDTGIFFDPPTKLRPWRHAVAMSTISLYELKSHTNCIAGFRLPFQLTNIFNWRDPDHGRTLRHLRNSLSHTYELDGTTELDGSYDPLFHYRWIQANVPQLFAPLREMLAGTILQMRACVAYEIKYWDTIFREKQEAIENERMRAFKKEEEIEKENRDTCPCSCNPNRGWKECNCASLCETSNVLEVLDHIVRSNSETVCSDPNNPDLQSTDDLDSDSSTGSDPEVPCHQPDLKAETVQSVSEKSPSKKGLSPCSRPPRRIVKKLLHTKAQLSTGNRPITGLNQHFRHLLLDLFPWFCSGKNVGKVVKRRQSNLARLALRHGGPP